jgi:hypothetical protein
MRYANFLVRHARRADGHDLDAAIGLCFDRNRRELAGRA